MNCNVEITAVGTADGLEVSIHGGSNGGRNENKTRCQKYRQKGGGV